MKNLSHDAAIDALCKCAASVSVLSYQEAIEGYFKLRGLAVPNQQPAQDGLVEALEKIGALHQPSHLNDAVQIARKALSAIKGDKS